MFPTGSLCALLIFLAFLPAWAEEARAVRMTVDCAGQVDGGRQFRHVHTLSTINPPENMPANWAVEEFEGAVLQSQGWFDMRTDSPDDPRWVEDRDGQFRFSPGPNTITEIRQVLDAGLIPAVVIGTANIPDPLILGGRQASEYSYNCRYPNDYAKWRHYLRGMFSFLAGEFGRENVRSWGFFVGVESDWQAKGFDPGTGKDLGFEENRRAWLEFFDESRQAAADVLGPNLYFGCYGAFESQPVDFIRHWTEGKNFATGKVGTQVGWTGFSDWLVVNKMPAMSPWAMLDEGDSGLVFPGQWRSTADSRIGFFWRYKKVEEAALAHPATANMDINLQEHGYFDGKGSIRPDGERSPVDLLMADYRGCALYALRACAYAEMPLLGIINSRWMWGNGHLANDPEDRAKPPVFHAVRMMTRMDARRVLPVTITGDAGQPGGDPEEDFRGIAAANPQNPGDLNVLAVNFANWLQGPGTPRKLVLELTNLPPALREIRVTGYLVDGQNNNWWADWTAYRKENGLAYVRGKSHTHLGSDFLWDEKYIENVANIRGTMSPEDYREWKKKSPEYASRDGLAPVFSRRAFPVKDGRASLDFDLAPNATLFLEVETLPAGEWPAQSLAASEGWKIAGKVEVRGDALVLFPGTDGAEATRVVEGLVPSAPYIVSATATPSVRVLDHRLAVAGANGSSAAAQGIPLSSPRTLAVTLPSDERGTLSVTLSARPSAEPQDSVTWSDIAIRPALPR